MLERDKRYEASLEFLKPILNKYPSNKEIIGAFSQSSEYVLALLPLGAGRGEGMAPARGGRAVLLAEGTLQEQLREREGGEAVAAGIEEAGMSRIGECESGRTWNGFRVEGGKAGQGVKFERIRRITGYLVGTVERFNDAKRAEVMDRVKHTV